MGGIGRGCGAEGVGGAAGAGGGIQATLGPTAKALGDGLRKRTPERTQESWSMALFAEEVGRGGHGRRQGERGGREKERERESERERDRGRERERESVADWRSTSLPLSLPFPSLTHPPFLSCPPPPQRASLRTGISVRDMLACMCMHCMYVHVCMYEHVLHVRGKWGE